MVDEAQKRVVVIDVAIPADANKKEHEKLEKYQGLKKQLEWMWKAKGSVVPVVVGALGAATPKLGEWLQHIPGTTFEVDVSISRLIALNDDHWSTKKILGQRQP